MAEIIQATLALYKHAFLEAVRSFARGWMIAVALVVFAVAMQIAAVVAGGLGFLGGFLLGAVNALLVGAMLALVEIAVRMARPVGFRDVGESLGQYFWDVISVGFVLWIPLMVLERGMAANPNGAVIGAMVFFLLFILLNPAPEVIYQVRPGSPLEVIRHSYEFVLENWIEWFLPLAIVIVPFGVSFFLRISTRLGGGAGLQLYELMALPFELLMRVLIQAGVPATAISTLVLILTPIATAFMMLFRGHLFAGLYGSSRRKRLFQSRSA